MLRALPPLPALRPYLARVEVVAGTPPATLAALHLPDGTYGLFLHRSGTVTHGADPLVAPTVVGLGATPRTFTFAGPVEGLHVVVRPAAAPLLLGTGPGGLVDRLAPADAVLPPGVLAAVADFDGPVEEWAVRVQRALLAARRPAARADRVAAAAVRLLDERGGRGRMPALAAELGVSESGLERAVRAATGVRPKLYARIVRFQRAVTAIRAGAAAGADLAQQVGFADQPHLVRDFRAFSGLPPGRFARLRPNADFLQDAAG